METQGQSIQDKDTVTRLTLGGRTFIIVGTAHVSPESVAEVAQVIETERPDNVCVEIDEARYRSLTEPSWEKLDIFQILKQGKGFLLLANLVLSSFQKRAGDELGAKPGEEMKVAVSKAQELGIPHTFIDREVQVTLRRAWSKSGFFKKAKLLAALAGSAFSEEEVDSEKIESMKKKGVMDEAMGDLAKELPTVKEVLIDERDQFLATSLFQAEGKKLVAVVGAGHVPGMITWLQGLEEGSKKADLTEISQIPKPSAWSKVWPWLIPGLVVGLFVAGFFLKGSSAAIDMVLYWVLMVSGGGLLGCLLSLAHPLTILVGVVMAPVTAIHPLLGIGLVTGFVEAWARKPRVTDLANLVNDAGSFKGFYRNRVTRVLLVAVLSSLGVAFTNFVAFPMLVTSLVK